MTNSTLVTVCDKCLRASCWNGEFMCDQAQSAGVIYAKMDDLIDLDLEHWSHWLSKEDYQIMQITGRVLEE
ncbi:hypothetical protein LCGC14_2995510 [marine sediment metagenome]|uniref:Uncharacterized protein n=1 Tax=marine sediment metagenome TaxID=412755 RepID=A0A0F8ZA28_9ZZZZ